MKDILEVWFREVVEPIKNLADIPPLVFLLHLQLEDWAIFTTICYTIIKTGIAISEFFTKRKHERNLSNKRTSNH